MGRGFLLRERPRMITRRMILHSVGATALAAALPGTARAAQPLRVSTFPIDAGAEPFYGSDNGMFAKAGLDVTVDSSTNGAAIIAAVMGGAADVGFSNVVSLAVAYKRGLPLTIIAPAGLYSSKAPTSVLMVASGSPIKTARDCNGKTFAVNGLKNITQFSSQAWVDKNGGDSKTLKFVELKFPEMAPALQQGRIDVALIAEPDLSDAKKVARVLGDSYDAIAPSFLIGAFCTTTAFAKANPDVVKRFAGAIRDVAAWSNAHHKETGDILARVTKIDPAIIAGMTRSTYAERFSPDDIQPSIDVAVKYGGLDVFSAKELVWTGA
jgi:NitT/TauT family transport system substrate-binding protein